MAVRDMLKTFAMGIARVVGLLLILSAVVTWWSYQGVDDCNPFRLFGCGLLDIGMGGVLGRVLNWFFVCVQGALGWLLITWKPKRTQPTAERP